MVGLDETILIIGAGPVGLAAAVEFRRRGFRPRIVDAGAGTTPVGQSRALGVLPTTLDILTPSGIAARMLDEGMRIDAFEIARDGRRVARLSLRDGRTRHPFILALSQGRTEQLMVDWLAGHGVAVEWQTAFTALEEGTSSPRVRLSSGESVSAALVVGADGVHSRVREAAGIAWSGQGYPAEFALADIVLDRPLDASTALVDFRFARNEGTTAVALLPLGERLARLVGVARSTDALLRGIEGVREVVWQSSFSVSFRHAERMARDRVFLAGDAAHVHSPVGGRGMNLGIWDAAWLAFLVSEGRESEYETLRLPSVRTVLETTRRGTDFITAPSRTIIGLLRYLAPAAEALPWARRRIAERVLALDLPQPEWLAPEAPDGPSRQAGRSPGGDDA